MWLSRKNLKVDLVSAEEPSTADDGAIGNLHPGASGSKVSGVLKNQQIICRQRLSIKLICQPEKRYCVSVLPAVA